MKMTINGTVIELREMNVAGGDLPKGFEIKLDVDIETKGATNETILSYAGGGQSARVRFQSTLRKLGPQKLLDMGKDVIKVHINDVGDEDFFLSTADKMKRLADNLTEEDRKALIEMLQSN